MSEENKEQSKASQNQTNDSETTVRIELDNDRQVERLQREKEDLLQKVTIYEHEQSRKKAESFYPPPAPKGGDTAPLNPPTDDFKPSSGSLLDREFESEQAAYAEISRLAKQGNSEAQAIERQLFNKLRKEGIDYEFYGDTHALYRQPKPITPDMTKEQIEYAKKKNAQLMAEKAKWRKVQ